MSRSRVYDHIGSLYGKSYLSTRLYLAPIPLSYTGFVVKRLHSDILFLPIYVQCTSQSTVFEYFGGIYEIPSL
jgi:hypothetical protein